MNPKHKLKEAIDTLYRHSHHANPESYTRLVLDCVRLTDAHQAKRLQSHMENNMFEPTTTFIHNRLLHVYANSGKLSDAQNLFDKMPQRDVFTYNAMLKAYSKLGSVDELLGLFNSIPFRDSVSYNSVIAGLGTKGRAIDALKVFDEMLKERFEVTGYTYVSVVNACSRVLDLERGKQVHGKIVACGLMSNGFVCNALADLYAKCGEIDVARQVFDEMSYINVVSWNLMISGYVNNGLPEKAFDMFYKMKLLGVEPDVVTVSNVLGAFFQTGRINDARSLFVEFEKKDVILWTAVITGHVQNGKEEDALMLFNDMLATNVKPDKFTISSVVSSCARLASSFHGQTIHGKSIRMSVDHDTLVSSALVDMYSKCGEPSEARKIFDTIHSKSIVSWNSMILGYAQNGKDLDALTLYEQMSNNDINVIKPDSITFVGVLSACIHEGLVSRGEYYFRSMEKQHGIKPYADHYACLINLYSRSGSVEKAVEIINTMPYEPNSLIWSTLLSICKRNGDIKHGEMAAKHLIKLEPNNAEPYITLSNMYAANGRWKDVAVIRSVMKTSNIKKFAAFSWVEIDGKVHKFVAEDRAHAESDNIYNELNRIIKKVLKAGFVPNKNLVLHDVGDDEKVESICYHSEKLALAYGLMKKPEGRRVVRILKNIRVCSDCHLFMKFVSRVVGCDIVLRDSNRFHHFVGGSCSCKDLW